VGGLHFICNLSQLRARCGHDCVIRRSRHMLVLVLGSPLLLVAASGSARRAAAVSAVASGDSIEQVDRGRDRESERRHDPGQLAAVLVGLGHHRVREHGEDRPGGEGKNEADGAR
jgi:hypothetical protein